MDSTNGSNFRTFALRGSAALALGLAAITWPGPSLAVLVALLGIFFLLDGIFAGLAAIVFAEWRIVSWPLAIEALAALGIGLITLLWPGLTTIALLYLLAAWAILVGAVQLATAYQVRGFVRHGWMPTLRGLPPLLLGLLLLVFPQEGLLALIRLAGLGVGLNGLYLLALAYRSHRLEQRAPVA